VDLGVTCIFKSNLDERNVLIPNMEAQSSHAMRRTQVSFDRAAYGLHEQNG
jgi:hypothetical protein